MSLGRHLAIDQVLYTLHLIQSSGHLWEPWLNHEPCFAVKETQSGCWLMFKAVLEMTQVYQVMPSSTT